MSLVQRLLSFGFIPIVALLGLQIYSPDTFLKLQNAAQPYISGTALSHFSPEPLPPRSELPLIVSSTTHWSHVEKIAAIAVELAELGYPVIFITGRVFEDHISKLHPNIKFRPTLGLDDKLSDEDLATYISLPSGVDQELFIMKKVLVDGMPDGHDTLQAEFRKFKEMHGDTKPLISLYDVTVTGHQPILFGAPGIRPDASIGISIAPLTLDSNDTFPFRTGKVPHKGPDAKAVHQKAYQGLYQDRLTGELSEYWWARLRDMGTVRDSYPHILHAMDSMPDHLLTLGIPEFEFPRSDLRPNVRYFGGFKKVGNQGAGKEPGLPPWWDDIAKAKKEGKKIIAVSQGTVEVRPEDLVLPTLEALKDRDDVLVIATFVISEPEDVAGLVVPENTRVAKFVPYDKLLPLVDLLVSNGGYGAVQHCLRLGVPMVVSGAGQDKAATNAIVEYTGVGINLGARQPGADKIAVAVKKVLEDDRYKSKVTELSVKYAKYEIGKVFDGIVQDTVRNWTRKGIPFKGEL